MISFKYIQVIIVVVIGVIYYTQLDESVPNDTFTEAKITQTDPASLQANKNKASLKSRGNCNQNMSTSLSAFVVGATGETGKALVSQLAKSPGFSRVTIIARRQMNLPEDDSENCYTKFDQKIVNFDKLEDEHSADFTGYDVGFCALGTTRGKAGRDGFIKVDHDYVMATGKLAKDGGCKHFNLVSSGGTNPNSWFLYPQVKGQVEEEMKGLGFPRLTIWKPGVLLCNREETRLPEKAVQLLAKVVDPFRFGSIHVPMLAKVMVNHCFEPQTAPVELIYNRDIYHTGLKLSSK